MSSGPPGSGPEGIGARVFASLDDLRAGLPRPAAGRCQRRGDGARASESSSPSRPAVSAGSKTSSRGWRSGRGAAGLGSIMSTSWCSPAITASPRRACRAYPAEVTAQMVANFAAGGAAINQLARAAHARLRVIPLALEQPTARLHRRRRRWTRTHSCAPSTAGTSAVRRGPTSSASARWESATPRRRRRSRRRCSAAAARAGPAAAPASTTAAWRASSAAIDMALARHAARLGDPLRDRGGARRRASSPPSWARRWRRAIAGIPVLLDGFVCTAAVAPLAKLRRDALDHALAAHVSAEAGASRCC